MYIYIYIYTVYIYIHIHNYPAALIKVVTKDSPFIYHFVFSMQIAVDMFTLQKHIYLHIKFQLHTVVTPSLWS